MLLLSSSSCSSDFSLEEKRYQEFEIQQHRTPFTQIDVVDYIVRIAFEINDFMDVSAWLAINKVFCAVISSESTCSHYYNKYYSKQPLFQSKHLKSELQKPVSSQDIKQFLFNRIAFDKKYGTIRMPVISPTFLQKNPRDKYDDYRDVIGRHDAHMRMSDKVYPFTYVTHYKEQEHYTGKLSLFIDIVIFPPYPQLGFDTMTVSIKAPCSAKSFVAKIDDDIFCYRKEADGLRQVLVNSKVMDRLINVLKYYKKDDEDKGLKLDGGRKLRLILNSLCMRKIYKKLNQFTIGYIESDCIAPHDEYGLSSSDELEFSDASRYYGI